MTKVLASFFKKTRCLPFFCLTAAACTTAPPQCASAPHADVVWVLSWGWHTEIGLPANELDGGLAFFRAVYPGLRAIMFGYGKRTFMTARADRASEYVLGPFPGPAVIEAVGLSALPPDAYGAGDMVELQLPPGGAAALSAFIWDDLARDASGGARYIGPGRYAGSRFYDAVSGYNLAHTCNSWVADALHAAGLPISDNGVVFSGQAMQRAAAVGAQQCAARPAP